MEMKLRLCESTMFPIHLQSALWIPAAKKYKKLGTTYSNNIQANSLPRFFKKLKLACKHEVLFLSVFFNSIQFTFISTKDFHNITELHCNAYTACINKRQKKNKLVGNLNLLIWYRFKLLKTKCVAIFVSIFWAHWLIYCLVLSCFILTADSGRSRYKFSVVQLMFIRRLTIIYC